MRGSGGSKLGRPKAASSVSNKGCRHGNDGRRGLPMKLEQLTRNFVVFTMVGGASACSGAGDLLDEPTGQITLAGTPDDPVADCQASGLNVIIGTSNNDVLNGTAAADCIVGLGGQDTINGL